MKKILIVEDDLALSAGLCFDLEADNYMTVAAYSCQKAVQLLDHDAYDLIILDVNLPDGNGFELCARIKQMTAAPPVIFLTACDLEEQVVAGFELGADDYIIKPFSINIFRKKIEVVLKRSQTPKKYGHIFQDQSLMIDFEALVTMRNGVKITITPNEYKILKLLVANPGNILTRQVLLDKLWDHDGNYIDEHTLTVNMNRLRSKIEDSDHKYIKTIYGMGYIWKGEMSKDEGE